jgi:Putative zinc-finger
VPSESRKPRTAPVAFLRRALDRLHSTPSGHVNPATLLAYRDGELPEDEMQRIGKHLEHCAECRTQSELERWQMDRLAKSESEVPAPDSGQRRSELQSLLRSLRTSAPAPTRSLLALLTGRKAAANGDVQPSSNRYRKLLIVTILVFHVMLGFVAYAAWRFTGNPRWVRAFFGSAGDLFLMELAIAAFYLALEVRRGFSVGEPLYRGWYLITTAFACDVLGSIFGKLLATQPNPLWNFFIPEQLHQFGLFMGGPLEMLLLGGGLLSIVHAYHRAGIITFDLSTPELLLLASAMAYTLCANIQADAAIHSGMIWTLQDSMKVSLDPLLLVLLGAAMVLRRSVQNLGEKALARCWSAMVWAICLIFVGDMIHWATTYHLLPAQIGSIGWHVWFVSGTSYALACAFQLQAMEKTAECIGARQSHSAAAG